ncbi:hypothetical protein SAZ11_44525 [Streptomyces sp. FXJ1.4098]|nr:hypothetical protein [Streptomyces sp. FXJ1.4098]
MPVGVVAGAWIGGQYTAAAAGLGDTGTAAVAGLVLAAAFAANLGGLHLSSRVQLLLVGLLAALLLAAVLAAVPHLRAAHFTPFMPGGWSSVGSAAGVLFFAFVGGRRPAICPPSSPIRAGTCHGSPRSPSP